MQEAVHDGMKFDVRANLYTLLAISGESGSFKSFPVHSLTDFQIRTCFSGQYQNVQARLPCDASTWDIWESSSQATDINACRLLSVP